MSRCRHCARSGVLLRTSRQGLCKRCNEEIEKNVEVERERIKEALIFVGILKDPRDRTLHLQRAMGSVRTLSRYEQLGGFESKPSPKALLDLLAEKLREIREEQRAGNESGSKAPTLQAVERWPELEVSPQASPALNATSQRKPRPNDVEETRNRGTRRATRVPASLRVQVDSDTRAQTEDVSPEGLRVRSVLRLKPGTRVDLALDAPEGVVTTQGMVRWTQLLKRSGDRSTQTVMGLEFVTPPREMKMFS